MTRKFRGSIAALTGLLLVFLMMGVGPLCAAFILREPHEPAKTLAMRIWFGLMGLFFGWYFGWGLLEWFSVYTIEEEGITRRAWNGTRRIRWPDLTRFKASGHKDGSLILTDNQNTELSIEFSLLNVRSGCELRELIAPHLDVLRERQMREIGTLNTVYHPNREPLILAGVASLLLTLLFFGGAVGMSAERPPDVTGASIFAFVTLLLSLLSAWMLILGLTRTLAVTQDGIVESSRFGSKTLLFHHVTALMTREVAYKGDKWEITRLEGEGKQKILLTSKMTDYPLLVEFIRARVPSSALQKGDTQAEESKVKERKQERIIIPICAAILFVMFTAMGVSILAKNLPLLARQRKIDAQGRPAIGHVIRRIEASGKDQPNLIEFAFEDAQGRRIVGASPVMYGEFRQTRIGDPAAVEYVPGRTDLCRLTQSIGRRRAVIDIVTAIFQLLCGLILMPYVVYVTFKKK